MKQHPTTQKPSTIEATCFIITWLRTTLSIQILSARNRQICNEGNGIANFATTKAGIGSLAIRVEIAKFPTEETEKTHIFQRRSVVSSGFDDSVGGNFPTFQRGPGARTLGFKVVRERMFTHGLHSSSFLGSPYRILNTTKRNYFGACE